MNDALIPASLVCADGGDLDSIVKAAVDAADDTADMEAKAGRSNYLSFETIKGTPDPGAKAVAFILQGIAEGLK